MLEEYPPEDGNYLRGDDCSSVAVIVILNRPYDNIPERVEENYEYIQDTLETRYSKKQAEETIGVRGEKGGGPGGSRAKGSMDKLPFPQCLTPFRCFLTAYGLS